jgi:hypothetical protein
LLALVGCSSDKNEISQAPPPAEQIKALSELDREKIAAFGKELFNIDRISAKAMALVGNEIKQVITGQKESVDAASLLDAAKGEAGKSLENMLKKAVPEGLPPWFVQNIGDAKKSFSDAYTARIASFDAIRRFIDEKNPVALIEYKQKAALADKTFRDARQKLAGILNASGLQAKDSGPMAGNTGK